MKHLHQSGFGILIVIVIIAVVGSVGTVGYLRISSAKNDKASQAAQTESSQKAAAAKLLAAQKKKDAAKKAAETPATPAATPAPAATPKPAVLAATPFTTANCTASNAVAYVSNKNGTSVSYQYPDKWVTAKTYSYGESITGDCLDMNAYYPGYININDAYIKIADLSSTKP